MVLDRYSTVISLLNKSFVPPNFIAKVIQRSSLLTTLPYMPIGVAPQKLQKINSITHLKISDDGRLQIISKKGFDEKILARSGKDGRIHIEQTSDWPYKVHGHLIMTFPNGNQYVGSGTMVGPYHVLTAGHNLYSHSKGEGWATKVTFIPAQNGNIAPWGESEGIALLSIRGWVNNTDPRLSMPYDMGMVILDRNLGETTGWVGLLSGSDTLLDSLTVNVTGYPGDKGAPNQWSNQMWTMGHNVKSLDEEKIYYDIDTFQGQSGSGLWTNYEGSYYAIGIHTYGEGMDGEGNSATRLTQEKFKCVIDWLNGNYAVFKKQNFVLEIDEYTLRQELTEFQFIDTLRKIPSLIKEGPRCFISYAHGIPEHEKLVCNLGSQLKEAGINVALDIWDNKAGSVSSKFIEKISTSDYIIFVGSKHLMKKYHSEGRGYHINLEIDLIIEKLRVKPGSVIPIILDGEKKSSLPAALGTIQYIDFKFPENYYSQVFELLETLLPNDDLSNFIKEFTTLKDHTEKMSLEKLVKAKKEVEEENRFLTEQIFDELTKDLEKQLKKQYEERKSFHAKDEEQEEDKKDISVQDTYDDKNPISNLPPPPLNLLDRTDFIVEINKKFENNMSVDKVPIFALTGQGGSGKTTLARQYASLQKVDVCFEINAELLSTFDESFIKLAEDLTDGDKDKATLNSIKVMSNHKEKMGQIIKFVKNKLQAGRHWILIYDNVDNLTDIQPYLFQSKKNKSMGKILLTTRNSLAENNPFIHYTLSVGPMIPAQKMELFSKIIKNPHDKNNLEEKTKGELEAFLENIPSYPLDVSLAANYIKFTGTSYHQYIENIKKYNKDFNSLQINILKELGGDYKKTRWSIVATTLQHLIDHHTDFHDLLLLISLLESQDIPRELLEKCKNETIVSDFIFHLRKYSIITNESFNVLGKTISLHRSTQAMMLSYLTDKLKINKNKLQVVSHAIISYCEYLEYKEDILAIIIDIHLKALEMHKEILPDDLVHTISDIMGVICYYRYNTIESQYRLESNIEYWDKNINKYWKKKAYALTYLGHVVSRTSNDLVKAKNLLEQGNMLYEQYNDIDFVFAKILAYLARIYLELARYEEAKSLLKRSIEIYSKLQADYCTGYGRALLYLSKVHCEVGEFSEPRRLLEQCIKVFEIIYPKNHPHILWANAHFGLVYLIEGNYIDAQKRLEYSIKHYKKIYAYDYPQLNLTSVGLIKLYSKIGNYQKARKLLTKVSINFQKHFSDEKPAFVWTIILLGNYYRTAGNYTEAKNFLEHGFKVYKKIYGVNHPRVSWVQVHLGQLYTKLGKYEEAMESLKQALPNFKKCFSDNHPIHFWASKNLAELYIEIGNYKEAQQILETSLKFYTVFYGENHLKTAQILNSLGKVHLLKHDLIIAEKLVAQAQDIFKEIDHPEIYSSLELLSDLYFKKSEGIKAVNDHNLSKQYDTKAINFLNEALQIAMDTFLNDSLHIIRLQSKLSVNSL
jgi:V8-like Glu-specific endopeptidase/tetratricopeptide (TPR) repeat protein